MTVSNKEEERTSARENRAPDEGGICKMVQKNALFTCEDRLKALHEQIDADETPRLITLSTCSDEFTDARTILLTLMDP